MKKSLIFGLGLGLIVGTIIGLVIYRNGISNNCGSEFWGDKYADMLKESGRGIANNSGSKFYSDLYIKEKFKDDSTR